MAYLRTSNPSYSNMRDLFCLFVVSAAASPPNILFVLIDDYGWNNFGPHAVTQPNAVEIQTPVMNGLVAGGVLLNRHYVFSFCSPSRSALHTGRNPIHVNVRVLNPAPFAARGKNALNSSSTPKIPGFELGPRLG